MDKKISILLVGIGGYGEIYLKNLLQNEHIILLGVVDTSPKNSIYYEELKRKTIPIFKSMVEFYQKNTCDLAIIATPIQLHTEQTEYALKNGSNVLCEKPLSANVKDIQRLKQTKKEQNKFIAVGFNWSFTDSIQQLKKDLLAKKFGEIKRLKSIVLWPRSLDYYSRSDWAGKMYSKDGDYIYDSVANNATAHFLHNLFYLTGDSLDASAILKDVTPELYRANTIETFDTCAIKVTTNEDIDIFFYASHAVDDIVNPMFEIECEHAKIIYDKNKTNRTIQVLYKNGKVENYKDPETDHFAKLDVCLRAIKKNDHNILCGLEAVSAHMKCIHAVHQSIKNIPVFPKKVVTYNKKEKLISVNDLAPIFLDCYENWTLPSNKGISWSHVGKTIKVGIS